MHIARREQHARLDYSKTVSVIIPLYDGAPFIEHAIKSALAQTCPPLEVLVCDDMSSDGGDALVETLFSNSPNVHVLRAQKNSGPGAARNRGVKEAKGDIIAFLDSDDLWLPQKLEICARELEKAQAQMVFHSYGFCNQAGKPRKRGLVTTISGPLSLPKYAKTTQIGMSTALGEVALFRQAPFSEDRSVIEDSELWLRYLRDGVKIIGIAAPLSLYRIHDKNRSQNHISSSKGFWKNLRVLPISRIKRYYYFACYVINAIIKRLRRNSLYRRGSQ